MSAMFAGSSRALLTSIIFALETTGQSNALLPLLAACIASYIVSFFLLKNTIMTEKIARRGVATPNAYEPDILDKIKIGQVLKEVRTVISNDTTIDEATAWLRERPDQQHNFYIVATAEGGLKGIVSASNLFGHHHAGDTPIGRLIKRKLVALTDHDTLKAAVEMMATENIDEIPVVSTTGNNLVGVLSYRDVLSGYRHRSDENSETIAISLKRRTLKMLVHGRNKLSVLKRTEP
jgi:CBS domain-containing protein